MANKPDSGATLSGNILLFYAFDVGDDIDFELIRKSGMIAERLQPLSQYFKNYHIPFSFTMPQDATSGEREGECIVSKCNRFGVLSFCYRVPFNDSFEGLKHKIIRIHGEYNKLSADDAKLVYDRIFSAIEKPHFYHLKNSYYVVQVNPGSERIMPEEFRKKHGHTISSLLRLETRRLSEYQRREIVGSTTGYSGEDFIIIDSEASFIYDDEYAELTEFFESALIQQLELQYFDRLLDHRLEYFYLRPYRLPFRAYLPFMGGKSDLPVQQLAKLQVDISVITERLESSIHMAGDAYFSTIYEMLGDKLSLAEWKTSITKKLSIIQDLYTVYQHRLETAREEILTVVIIVLIAVELVVAFIK